MGFRNRRFIFLMAGLILIGIAILNVDVSIRQGIDGHIQEIRIPLYVKGIEFLARHYEYSRIAKEITAPYKTDEEKVLAILKWTNENIKQDIPEGFSTVDDHILNIIIRGYGSDDQSQDVFTTLCSYSNFPAFWKRIYSNNRTVRYPISFVKIKDKWRVFDSYYGKYFKTEDGDIAGVEDILRDKSIIKHAKVDGISYNGVPYEEFFYNLKPINPHGILRPDKQKPLRRIIFEIKKRLSLEKENLNE